MDHPLIARSAQIADELERVDGSRPGRDDPDRKHRKMAENPFRFFRGAAQLFYADLAHGVLNLPGPFIENARLTAIIGDCHMANFGFVTEKGSHGSHIIFTPNDFDDACVGHAAWDLARFVTSIFLAVEFSQGILDRRYECAELGDPTGLSAPRMEDAFDAAKLFLKRYRRKCAAIADDPYKRREALSEFPKGHVLKKAAKKAQKRAIGGRKFETKSKLGKAVAIEETGLRFRDRPRYRRLDAARTATIRAAFRPYVDDAVIDLVERLGQGTGSVNVERYYLLVGPESASTVAELPMCHIVEVKQQRQAAPIHFFPDLDPRNSLEPAHLTVDLQRLVQREPDLLLDEVSWNDAQWLVRSRHHAKVDLDPEEVCIARKHPERRLTEYVESCAEVLALTHSRGDYRSARFETAIAAAVAQGGEALIETSRAYAERTVEDWELLRELLATP